MNIMTNMGITSGVIHDNKIEFSVPITKVDKEKRMVHGFATLDNLDLQGDVVPLSASLEAFKTFRGNIREMHDPLKAVGKMVSFRPERYYDPNTEKTYNGVFVSTYVSKGAQDTWEKVIDGTLTGFSIGGNLTKTADAFDDDGSYHRVVEKYSLFELSLVDNPANQFASIVSIEKNADNGYLAKTEAENVFWCRKDNKVQITSAQATTCYSCDGPMLNIGFVESNDTDRMSVVKSLLANIKDVPAIGDTVEFDEGSGKVIDVVTKGQIKLDSAEEVFVATETDPVAIIDIWTQKDDTMVPANRRTLKNVSSLTKNNEKEDENVENPETEVTVVDEVIEESAVEEPVVAVEDVTEPTVEAEETEEVAVDESTVEKSLSEIINTLKSLSEAIAPMVEMMKSLSAATQASNQAVEELQDAVAKSTEQINLVKSETKEFGDRVAAVEGTTAFRKSADLGEIVQPQPKKAASKWGGLFLDPINN